LIAIPGAVLCCGNLTQDILAYPVDNVAFEKTSWVERIETSPGGNGSNTAYALALLGTKVRLAGAVGCDEFGDRIAAVLQAAGVDLRLERTDERTATTIVLVDSSARRAFLHRPGASRRAFSSGIEFTGALIDGCSHCHLGNPFALPALREHAGKMLAAARAAGLTTSLDTGWDARGEWMSVIGPCLPHLDILFTNDAEAAMLTGAADSEAAVRFFRRHGARDVVIKLGAEGCVVFDGGEVFRSPAFQVEAVDTTGAGDCFAGAFLAGLQRGVGVRDAARLANAAGALSVQGLGATSGLLPYHDMVAWIKARAQNT
jgi:sugar/nucleoside kinase (ribokinase family)